MQTLPGDIKEIHGFRAFTFTRINKNNLQDMAVLYHAVYGLHLPNGYYLRKYNTDYTGKINIGYIAYSDSQLPVAYYGVIPCFLQCGITVVLAAQSADTMTHPEYRNKGLLAELYRLTLDLCKRERIKILFGFPNQNFYPILKNKYNWKETGKMDRFELPVNPKRLALFLRHIPGIKKIYKIYQRILLKQYILHNPELNDINIKNGYCGLRRDRNYLEYKKYNNSFVISIGLSKAWIKIGNDLTIGDIDLAGNTFDEVITRIIKIASQLGIRRVHFHASKQIFLHDMFIKHLVAIPSFPVLFNDLGSGMQLENIKFTFADIDIF